MKLVLGFALILILGVVYCQTEDLSKGANIIIPDKCDVDIVANLRYLLL